MTIDLTSQDALFGKNFTVYQKQMTEQNQQPETIEINGVKYQRVEGKKTERSPAEEAYKRSYGDYPNNTYGRRCWERFLGGYNESLEDLAVSPAERAYIRVYGETPQTSVDAYNIPYSQDWYDFSTGYCAAKKDNFRKLEEPKTMIKTIYDICVKWCNDEEEYPSVSGLIAKIEKEWKALNPKQNRGFDDSYSAGFGDAINLVRKTLK